ncbi:MAG: beta-lactamase family protein [Acidobacteria bacterium]|nr:beta-lactamase family protein [Acidobacteriota bacterium]
MKISLVWVLFGLLILPAAVAQKLDSARIAEIQALIEKARVEAQVPGLSAAIGFAGRLRWEQGFGTADLESGSPATAQTLFRTASIAKPMTGTALLTLVEEGKIDLDAEIQRYVPTFPKKRWPVTVRQLLGHIAGVRHYKGDEFASTRRYEDTLAPLAIFQADPLLFEPGTDYSYSTYGFNLLGAAVENVAGEPYFAALRQRVLEPAGMWNTQVDDVLAVIPGRTRFYRLGEDNRIYNAGLTDLSNKIPGGGLLSTSGDLVRFALATLDGSLLKPATVNEMWTPQVLKNGELGRHGLGWGVQEKDGEKRARHTGGQQGATTNLTLVIEDGVAVAVMTNREGFGGLGKLVEEILEIVRRP